MIIEIITASIKTAPYINKGIKDKRYRSGYRVIPYASCSPLVEFVIRRIPDLRVGQVVQLYDKWGTYIVTKDAPMTDTMTIIPVKTSYQLDVNFLVIPRHIIGSRGGFNVSEGNSSPTPNPALIKTPFK